MEELIRFPDVKAHSQLTYGAKQLIAREVKSPLHTHTHKPFISHFPGKPGLPGCLLDLRSPFIPVVNVLMGQKLFLDALPPILLQLSFYLVCLLC